MTSGQFEIIYFLAFSVVLLYIYNYITVSMTFKIRNSQWKFAGLMVFFLCSDDLSNLCRLENRQTFVFSLSVIYVQIMCVCCVSFVIHTFVD